jgi:hypothetical protein
MIDQQKDPARRRRVILGLLLSGIAIILAILWGIWAVLHKQSGVLIVTSRPIGAEVILNHRPTNLLTNAFLADLPADSFVVSVRMDGHRPVPPTQGVTIQPGETTRVTFLMAPIARGDSRKLPTVSGTAQNWLWRIVKINSAPDDASLVVDDKELGITTPATVLFEPGLHHLQARWPDGARSFKNIMIDQSTSQPEIVMRPMTYEMPKPSKGK